MDALRVPDGSGGRTMGTGGGARAQPRAHTAVQCRSLHPPVTRTPHPANMLISYPR